MNFPEHIKDKIIEVYQEHLMRICIDPCLNPEGNAEIAKYGLRGVADIIRDWESMRENSNIT